MIPLRRSILVKSLNILDLLLPVLSLLIAAFLVDLPDLGSPERLLATEVKLRNAALISGFLIIWHCILSEQRLYVSRRLSSIRAELKDIVKATSLGTLSLLLLSQLCQIRLITFAFLFGFWGNVTLLTILIRLMLRYCLRTFRVKGLDVRNIVIIGSHGRALHFAEGVISRPELGYRLVGFVDEASEISEEFKSSGYHLIADFDTFQGYVRKSAVDEVMICLPVKSHYQQAARIAAICEEHGIIVRFLSDIFNPKMAYSQAQQFEGHAIITFYTGNMRGGGIVVKRAVDIMLSLFLIVQLSPLLLLVALLIKATSRGPVLFVQKRLGMNKHIFGVYKFRTMCADAEKKLAEVEHLNEQSGPVFKIRDDPRITAIGKFLRRTSIDELPQLLNVLKGDMSLVGPRPLQIRDFEGFDKDWHRRRFSVRPGITCLWQIKGRNNLSFEKWMELDMEYIDNWSLWLDARILLKTIPAVLKRSGAC